MLNKLGRAYALLQPAPYTGVIAQKEKIVFEKNIEYSLMQLEHHRKKRRWFLIWAWVFAFLIFGVIFIFTLNLDIVLKVVAQIFIQTHAQVATAPSSEVELPDFVALINEHYLGYWAVSGFIVLLIACLGLIKHHTNRAVYFETLVQDFNKLDSIAEIDGVDSKLAEKIINTSFSSSVSSDSKLILNPLLESITSNTQKIIEKINSK